MNYRRLIIATSILTVSLTLSLAFGLEHYWAGSMAALGVGVWGWYGFNKARNVRGIDIYFVGVVLLVTIGGILDLMTVLLFFALIGALGAWDLTRFQKRIEHSPHSESIPLIEKRHLTLLGIALLGGCVLAGIMLNTRAQISFSVTLILGIVLIISLGEIIRIMRN